MDENLHSVLRQATGLPPSAIHITLRSPLDHQSNRLYDGWVGGRHLIAKQYLQPDELEEAPAREFGALTRLASLDIAPRPVFFDPSLAPIVVYEYLPGAMWDRHRPAPADLNHLAQLWLTMNTVPTDGLWMSRGYERSLFEIPTTLRAHCQTYATWAESEFPSGCRAADLCFELLNRRAPVARELFDHDAPLRFCRADPRFANVITRPDGRLALVDWEDSGLRDPARDLADIIVHPNQEDLLTWDDWQAFLQPYLTAYAQTDPLLAERTHLYLALFPLFYLLGLMRRGVQRAAEGRLAGWTANSLPINLRLRRYLARALAWPAPYFDDELASLAQVEFFP